MFPIGKTCFTQLNCFPVELTEALLLQPVVNSLYKILRQQFQDKTKLMFSLQDFGELLYEPWEL